MTSIGDVKLRATIQFCEALGKTPTQTYSLIQDAGTVKKCCRSLVFKWHRQFKEGRESIEDDVRTGRPAENKPENVQSVRELLEKDRRLTVRTISAKLGLSSTSVYRILKDDLSMSKVSARWVPRLLSAEHKARRVECSTEFLIKYEAEGDSFLNRIITMDETWIWEYDPETKAESSVWKTTSSPVPKKARISKSGGKHMFVFFMDRKGMLLVHKVPDGRTVNASYYSKLLRRELVHALQKKRPDTDLSHFVLHQDNAPPHTAASTQLEIDVLGFQRISHPPYSPDLAPMDFKVFPELKSQLRGRRFDNAKHLMSETLNIVSSYDKQFYQDIFIKWVARHRKCVRIGGEYVEKD